jgi:hypothetical protein
MCIRASWDHEIIVDSLLHFLESKLAADAIHKLHLFHLPHLLLQRLLPAFDLSAQHKAHPTMVSTDYKGGAMMKDA